MIVKALFLLDGLSHLEDLKTILLNLCLLLPDDLLKLLILPLDMHHFPFLVISLLLEALKL